MSIFYLAAAASAVILMPTNSDQPRKAHIAYSDLNLASPAGQKALEGRVRTALNMVCGYEHEGSAATQANNRQCRKRAMVQIEPQRQAAIAQASKVQLATNF
ncbi:MAG: UrcA family protein [Sphingopyxis sp.]|nr:UrcA family protein [Sphingopyxis sp.]